MTYRGAFTGQYCAKIIVSLRIIIFLVIFFGSVNFSQFLGPIFLSDFFQQMEESKGSYSGSRTSLLNIMMELRKCVLHPYLFQGNFCIFFLSFLMLLMTSGVEPEPFEEGEHLVKASEKLVLLDRILEFLNANGHRVLIFSQMTRLLDIVQDFLTYRGCFVIGIRDFDVVANKLTSFFAQGYHMRD